MIKMSKAQKTSNYPQATDDQLTALSKLQQQYADIKKQLKDAQLQCKIISRQIGEAKRSKQSTEQLMHAMQEQGRTVTDLKTRLNGLTEKLSGYLKPETGPEKPLKKSTLPPARVHVKHNPNNEQISIAQLANNNEQWNQYVESNPAASLYHRAEWKELINNVFGHECYFFYASSNEPGSNKPGEKEPAGNEKIVGILPLVRLNSKLFGDFMVSMPYFNSGGAIANSLLIEQKLMTAVNDFAAKIGTAHIEYRDDITRDELPARTEKVNMILSLPKTEDVLWQTFTPKLRAQIRRAQRENIQIKSGGTECLTDFYTVFARNMRDLGTPVYGKKFFNNILHTFSENSKIITLHHKGRPVAAAFLLGHKDTLEIPWASTIKDVNHLSINMLLYWEVLKFAVKNQYQHFDFGRSSKGSGTFRFKQQWGAKPKQLFWHYWLSDNAEMPRLNPDNPKFALAINVWRRIPVFITKLIGPFIVKNLP
jgi:FemAB-related protein (PEP-CTERM system-associated)